MRILTSALLAALVLTLPLSVIAAPSLQSNIDIKTLALGKGDITPLWSGFDIVPDRTVSEDRPDGVAVYDVTFARERTAANLASGPVEVRSGVARTSQTEDAILQLESTKEAFLGEGWTTAGVPPLGDEALGLTQSTDGEGGQIAHYSYLFRKGQYILMVGIRGRPETVKVMDAVGLAIIVSGRLDKALAGGAPSSSGPPSAPASSGSATQSTSGTGERVKVIDADGASVNMRAEPSTSAEVVTQVSEGTTLEIVGPNRDGDGRTWRNVKTSDNKTGWIASTFLETVAAPAPAPVPGPSPAPAPAGPSSAAPSNSTTAPAPAETVSEEEDENGGDEGETPAPGASPSPSPAPSPAANSGGNFRGTGNGLTVDGEIRETNLSGGKQLVKVHVTRNNRGVGNAFVDITARLDAQRFRAIKADLTNNDGWTEVEWDMEGPAGTYEVLVEVKTDPNGPVTTAKGSFKWK